MSKERPPVPIVPFVRNKDKVSDGHNIKNHLDNIRLSHYIYYKGTFFINGVAHPKRKGTIYKRR